YGTWKSFTEVIDRTKATPTVVLTAGADPTANNWNLGPGSDPQPAGAKNEGYGAEMTWNIASLGLLSGHGYRFYVIVHDGGQNKTGGDSGQTCINAVFTGAGSVKPSIPQLAARSTNSAGAGVGERLDGIQLTPGDLRVAVVLPPSSQFAAQQA